MAKAKNKVIAGDYNGESVSAWWPAGTQVSIGGKVVNKRTVSNYEVITEEIMKSGSSAIMRGALGATVLGPVGILAGLSAKNKGIHTLALQWSDGKKSLVEIEDRLYKIIMKEMF